MDSAVISAMWHYFKQFVILLFPLIFVTGCLCDPDYCAMPNLFHPGHIDEQKERMNRFDPFARADIGTKIEGDRPAGSQQQTPLPQHFDHYK